MLFILDFDPVRAKQFGMKMKAFVILTAALIVQLLVIGSASPLSAADSPHGPQMRKGVTVIAPSGGFIRHTLPAAGPVPERTDWGPEAGLFFGHFRKSLTAIVFPYWADANGAHVIGGAGHLDLYFLDKRWYNPVIGAGMNALRIDVKGSDLYDINVFSPWAKAGMRFKLPVRGLSITPYVSYLFETIDRSRTDQAYHSILFGMNLHYYLHRRLQIAVKYFYRYTPDARNGQRIRARFISSIHDHVGIFLRAEYAKQIYDEQVNVLIGPSFVF